jgi:hypothetical protein
MPKGFDIRRKATVQEGIVFHHVDSFNKVQVIEYQPGNGTKYVLVITRITEPASPSELRDRLGTGGERDTYLVAKVNGGYGTAVLLGGVNHYLHFNTIQEKLGCSISDAVVLAELLGQLLDMPHMTCEEFEAEE